MPRPAIRLRRGGGWLKREEDEEEEDSDPIKHAFLPSIDDETYRFWAAHTEQHSVFLLHFMIRFVPAFFVMSALQVVTGAVKVDQRSVGIALFIYTFFGLLWSCSRQLECALKKWPVILGSAVQLVGHALFVIGSVVGALFMSTELMQHRSFLTNYFTLMLSSSAFFVPRPVFLFLICPMYISGWLAFHILAGFVNVPCFVYGLITVVGVAWLRKSQDQGLRDAFDARDALLKERQSLQIMQESLLGVVSSIFDASCICDSNGQTSEGCPQLEAIIDCIPRDQGVGCNGINLCASAATDDERQRLQAFLQSAIVSARHQAAKIQCSFRRKLGGIVEACLYAIVLPDPLSSGDQCDSLFVVVQAQPLDSAAGDQVTEQDLDVSEQLCEGERPLEIHSSKTFIEDSRLPARQQTPVDWSALRSVDENMELGSLGSLSLSEQLSSLMGSDTHRYRPHVKTVETQTMCATFTADAEVQTMGTMARPPVSRQIKDHLSKRTRTRRVAWRGFKPTPRRTVRQSILGSVLGMNPLCVPSCCPQHTILRYVRHEITSMVKSTECSKTKLGHTVQCQTCWCIQAVLDDDDDLVCEFCNGCEFRGPSTPRGSDESESSGIEASSDTS